MRGRAVSKRRGRVDFPTLGIRAALNFAALGIEDVDTMAVGWNPAVNLEMFNAAHSSRARYLGELFHSVPNHLMNLTPNCNADFSSS